MTDGKNTALVVGASGMLLPVAQWCSERYAHVVTTCSTRDSAELLESTGDNVIAVESNWTTSRWWTDVDNALQDYEVSLAVVWMHSDASDGLLSRCAGAVAPNGLFIRIHGHAAARPVEGEFADWIDSPEQAHGIPKSERHLVLGWHPGDDSHWLSSEEIGAGVVNTVERWQSNKLEKPVTWIGSVRPWETRPTGWS